MSEHLRLILQKEQCENHHFVSTSFPSKAMVSVTAESFSQQKLCDVMNDSKTTKTFL